MAPTVQIVWFKRDLRVRDHPALVGAAAAGPVLPLYIVEPAWWAQETHSARQWAFIAECLDGLRTELGRLGAPLILRRGDAVETLEQLRVEFGDIALWSHEETGDAWSYARDLRVAAWARHSGVSWRELPQAGVVRRLRSRDGWAKQWEARMSGAPLAAPPLRQPEAALSLGAVPTAQTLDLQLDECPDRQSGGEKQASELLRSFLHQRGRDYRRAMSSPVSGFDACSRLSPHLAWGTISSRTATQAARAQLSALRAGEPGAAKGWIGSLESFQARMHWRCHFMQKLEDEPAIEKRCMHTAFEGLREEASDPVWDHAPDPATRLRAWASGETGLPFVDACMRALRATGWMNFRMRSMLTAVASYHLWVDWRRSGPVLARLFTDFEPGIHWSQMQMQSGVTGINTLRVYNPVKQSRDQDPNGVFIRRWLPELAAVSDLYIHEPWRMDRQAQREAGCVLGRDYPEPIVDHEISARAAKALVYAVRGGEAFRAEKAAVTKKHASRKPGRDNAAKRRKPSRRPKAASSDQMELDL